MAITMGAFPDLSFLDLPTGMLVPRQHPHELHWRIAPPVWSGNLDKAHARLYGHLDGHSCCTYCGSVPCPVNHEEIKQGRLRDLEFVKDMAKERREFKTRMEELETELKAWEQKSEEMKHANMMLEVKVKELEDRQRAWEKERSLMEAELNRLRALNDDAMYQLSILKKKESKLKLLQLRIEALQTENEQLKNENTKYKQMIVNQSTELQNLTKENKQLSMDLADSKKRIRSLTVQVDQYKEDVQVLKSDLEEKDAKVQSLYKQMSELVEELATRTREFEEKELQAEELITTLRSEVLKLQARATHSESRCNDLESRLAAALQEIERLRRRLANNSRFRKYVEVKREVIDLRDKNEALVHRFSEELKPVLPVMKEDGRVRSANVRSPRVELPPTRRAMSASIGSRRSDSFSDMSITSSDITDVIVN